MALNPTERVLIDPPASTWRELIDRRGSNAVSIAFRRELGLPDDGVIVMSGHQAEFWHPGILAKYVAMHASAESLRRSGIAAHAAWVVVDQDTNDAFSIAFPAVRSGVPTRGIWRVPGTEAGPTTPTGLQRTVSVNSPMASNWLQRSITAATPDTKHVSQSVESGIPAIASALASHASAASAAEQVTRATADLLISITLPARTFMASAIGRTELFARVLQRMRASPARWVQAYNAAAALTPSARVRPLGVLQRGGATAFELPVWELRSGARHPVWSDQTPTGPLAPRALFMTALLRMAGCELFIHGMGGGVYDRVTDAWIGAVASELDPELRTLAPTAVVTATRHIPMPAAAAGVHTPEQIESTLVTAERAKHDPASLGDTAAANRKRELVETIRRAKGDKPRRAALYRELQAFLGEYRERNGGRIEAAAAAASDAATQRAAAGVVFDRTWPFPLYPENVLRGLAAEIAEAFEVTG